MLVYARNESYLTDSEIIFRGAKEGVDYLQDLFNKSQLKHGDNWDLIKEDVLITINQFLKMTESTT
jgi:adenine-specific DNA-methyltransferase